MCNKIINNICSLTGCVNPQPDFCLHACPLLPKNKGMNPHEAYTLNKYGIKPGEKYEQKPNKVKSVSTVDRADTLQRLSLMCNECAKEYKDCRKYDYEHGLRTWGSCCMNTLEKFSATCPLGKFTEEIFREYVK